MKRKIIKDIVIGIILAVLAGLLFAHATGIIDVFSIFRLPEKGAEENHMGQTNQPNDSAKEYSFSFSVHGTGIQSYYITPMMDSGNILIVPSTITSYDSEQSVSLYKLYNMELEDLFITSIDPKICGDKIYFFPYNPSYRFVERTLVSYDIGTKAISNPYICKNSVMNTLYADGKYIAWYEFSSPIRELSIMDEGKYRRISVGCKLYIYNIEEDSVYADYPGHVSSEKYRPVIYGDRVLITTSLGVDSFKVKVVNFKNNNDIYTFETDEPPCCAAMNEKYLVTMSAGDHHPEIVDLKERKHKFRIMNDIDSFALYEDLLILCESGEIKIYDLETREFLLMTETQYNEKIIVDGKEMQKYCYWPDVVISENRILVTRSNLDESGREEICIITVE